MEFRRSGLLLRPIGAQDQLLEVVSSARRCDPDMGQDAGRLVEESERAPGAMGVRRRSLRSGRNSKTGVGCSHAAGERGEFGQRRGRGRFGRGGCEESE